jgi:type IV pilus assembly protein PilM
MFNFGRKKTALLGVDISSTSIKLVELSQSTGVSASLFHVETYAVEALPANAVVEKKIADVQVVGQTIQEAVARSGTKTIRAAAAVSGSAAITKTISMSASLTPGEMEAQIQLEADQYIPYPLEEVNIDFEVLGPSSSSPDMVDVLLAASRRENVDDRVAALEIAGLTAAVVDVEAYAMENACALLLGAQAGDQQRAKTVAVADVGATTTNLHVLHDGRIVYTREQNFGGLQLIEEIQRRYSLSRDQALQNLINGSLPETFEPEILTPFKETLAQQIGRALQFFYSSSIFNRVDQVIVAGGSARIRKVDGLIEDRLGIPTVVANPFTHMSLAPRIKSQDIARDAPSLMIAVGLALRGFD